MNLPNRMTVDQYDELTSRYDELFGSPLAEPQGYILPVRLLPALSRLKSSERYTSTIGELDEATARPGFDAWVAEQKSVVASDHSIEGFHTFYFGNSDGIGSGHGDILLPTHQMMKVNREVVQGKMDVEVSLPPLRVAMHTTVEAFCSAAIATIARIEKHRQTM